MERNCKNCADLIYAGKSHCSGCGAKWIENRITMKQVGNDFVDMYIGIDTKFARTFLDLFRKPEAVILGYMNGRRVNYMDAVRYMLLALFVTGIYMFIMRSSGALDQYLQDFQSGWARQGSHGNDANMIEFQRKTSDVIFDYLGIITLSSIPLLALIGRITFWGKRYFNFTEQIVFYLYTFAQITIATTPISLILLWISPEVFTYWSFMTYPIMFIYNAYCYKKCFQLDLQTTILKSLIAVLVLSVMAILIFFLLIILTIITLLIADKVLGYDLSAFLPQK
ncbi:DUF3667 domain-containing protein [Nonlabens sp. Asnod2-A12]|uniref:DUF3667 domain-containing protein n=1 Tax=Nonlabens sp. Asnod2-A12 TaxID=3160578 RepID=UPI003865CF4B